jgi:phosphomannomutase
MVPLIPEMEVIKRTGSIIGGEGNGGVILPSLHYGRDALAGIALFLSLLAEKKCSMTELRNRYPKYYLSKNRVELKKNTDSDALFRRVQSAFPDALVNLSDGLRLDFEKEKKWVSLRKSNTEPILRIYSEAPLAEESDELAGKVMKLF